MGIYDRDYYQEDDLRPIRPWDNRTMVSMLIIVNAALFVGDFLLSQGGKHPLTTAMWLHTGDLTNPLQWYRLLSYGFAHNPNGIGHILFNMLGLYFLGQGVESKYGKWEFLRIYLVSIVLCGVVWCLVHRSHPIGPLLGASGAVTTIAMLFVFSFPQAVLYLYGAIPVKAWVLGIVIIATNALSSPEGVANDVHLVGAALAAIYFFANLNFGFIEDWFSTSGRARRKSRAKLKIHTPQADTPSADQVEADRILEKIHRDGQDSLTSKERKFLEEYSRRIREQRQH